MVCDDLHLLAAGIFPTETWPSDILQACFGGREGRVAQTFLPFSHDDGGCDVSDDDDDLFTDYAGMMRGLYPGQTPNPSRWTWYCFNNLKCFIGTRAASRKVRFWAKKKWPNKTIRLLCWPCTTWYQAVPTYAHQVPASIVIYWPSTIKYHL